jgi:hypothetical protein
MRTSIEGSEEKNYTGAFAVIIVLVLIGGVLFAMMSGGPPTVSQSEGILEQSAIAVKDITRESFTFQGNIESDFEGRYVSLPISGEGRIDAANQRLYFKLNFENPIDVGEEQIAVTLESYVIGKTVYSKLIDVWTKYERILDPWGDSLFSTKVVGIANSFDSSVVGEEVVNGKEAVKIRVVPTVEEMVDLLETLDPGIADRVGISNTALLGRAIKSMVANVWIDKETLLPVKAELTMEIKGKDIDPSGVGVVVSDMILTAEINFDYNTPFNIVLPSEAQDAIEL